MTSAYAAIANGGFEVDATGILAAVDGRGEVPGNSGGEPHPGRSAALHPADPFHVARGRAGGDGRGAASGLKTYGKTGTTSGNADAWFIGWSEGRVLGVWMGKRRDEPGEASRAAARPRIC